MKSVRKKIYKHVRTSFFTFSVFVGVYNAQAQNVIDAGGGDATGTGGTVAYSIGQVVYTFNSTSEGRENQGVQQPVDYAALPVTLVNFEVNPVSGHVQVRWKTTAEVNNDFFTLERSVNSIVFEEVTRINALPGNSSALREYNWTDSYPQAGVSYYRLKQTDFDKSFSYSTIKSVSIKSLSAGISVYPNPVGDYLMVNDGDIAQSRSYKIFDLSGRLVETKELPNGARKIDMTHLSPAAYLIQYTNNGEVQKFKIIKN